MTGDWRPPYAYVPGQTPRHPEGMFDSFKAGLQDTPRALLQETRAWETGLAFLRDGYFWEAHEVLEAVWMVCPPNSAERLMVQAVIQRANAGLKAKMGQAKAVSRLLAMSDALYREAIDRADQQGSTMNENLCNKMHEDFRKFKNFMVE